MQPPTTSSLLGAVLDPATCDPATRCCCGDGPALSWPMHWRPDVAPPAPWTWLDNRQEARRAAPAAR